MTKNLSYTELTYLYQQKQRELLSNFPDSSDPKQIYEKIIKLGQLLPPFPLELRTEKTLVSGCQSEVFLLATIDSEGKIFYQIHSDALISAGLAALLLSIYQGEYAELTLLCPPLFITELGLAKNLSPGRSNGLASIYSRMKAEAMNLHLKRQS